MNKRKKIFTKIIAGLLCISLMLTFMFVEFYGFPLLAAQEEIEDLAYTPSEGEEPGSTEEEKEPETEDQNAFQEAVIPETEKWVETELPYESPGEASAENRKKEFVVDTRILRDNDVDDLLDKYAPACGTISKNTTWTAGTLKDGELIINEGVTLTINGQITVSGTVTVKGGGRILRGNAGAYFYVESGADLTIGNIEIEGNSISSENSMIVLSNSKLTLDDGCKIQNCSKNVTNGEGDDMGNGGGGGALYAYKGEIIFDNVTIENCSGPNYGGAIAIRKSNMTIYSGVYKNNKDKGTYTAGVIYSMYSKLYVYGGYFIDNTSNCTIQGSGCILSTGSYGAETYINGGYFKGNKSIVSTTGKEGGGAVYFSSSHNNNVSKECILGLSGDAQFCGDGVENSGTDVIYLDFGSYPRKIQLSSSLKSPVHIYLKASEGYVMAEGANGYILQEKDMNQIHFTDTGNSGKKWYAWLNKETNEIYLSEKVPPYGYYMYYSGNGARGNVTDDTEYMSGNEAIVKSDEGFTFEGYRFDGWNTQPDGKGTSYEAGNKIKITGNLTLYAQWIKEEEKRLKADFYSGSERNIKTIKAEAGNPVIKTPFLEEIEGWTAVGWEDNISGYTGGIAANTEITLSEDTSYYGVYQKDVTLSYDGKGGGNVPESETKTCYANVHGDISYTYGVDTQFIVGHESTPEIEDAVFIGWNDKSDGTGNLYRAGDHITLTEDKVLYAVYEVPPFATFYFGSADHYIKRGVNLLTGNRTIEIPTREEMEVMDMTGWTALGFNSEAENCGYGEYTLDAGTTLTLGTEYLNFYGIYKKDVTLTYAYEDTPLGKNIIEEHTQDCYANVHNEITYQFSEGLSESYDGFQFTITLGEDDITIPDGHKFAGWSTDMRSDGQLYEEGDQITIQDDTTLFTQWSLAEYEINFNLNGGEGETPAAQIVTYDSLLHTVADPEKKGYSFVGWYKDKEGTEGNQWDFGKNVEQNTSEYNVTLYAKYVDDIAPVLGEVSYNTGYKNILNWIVRKKNLILTVPITEEGSGVKEASYILTPEEGTENIMTSGSGKAAETTNFAEIEKENGQLVAKITVDEDFKGSVLMSCNDNAGNSSPTKLITASNRGIIVEDNAPEIIFSSPDGKLSDYHLDEVAVSVKVEDSDVKDSVNERVSGGIARISYRIDGGEEKDVYSMIFQNSLVESFMFTVDITGEGEHTLSVTAVDNAGNETTSQISVFIYGEHTYQIEYYKQDITGNGYTRADDETENLIGTTGSNVKAITKDFIGFTENVSHESRVAAGTVTADDALVLRLYYDRITYEIDFDLNGMDGETPAAQTVHYGGFLEKVKNPTKKGYSFKGWYSGKEGTNSREWDFNRTVESNTASHIITLYAKCVDDIAPILGKTSYNKGYKNIKNWIIRKNSLILTIPITEEGSGIDRAEYILMPEGEDEGIVQTTDDSKRSARAGITDYSVAAKTNMRTAKVKKEDGRYVALITITEDFKGSVLLSCSDQAGNRSAEKTVTILGGGVIVEDNAPKISFSSKEGDLSDWFLNTADVNVTVEDDGNGKITGGISGISYRIDGGKSETVDKNFDGKIVESCDFTVNISGAAEHTLTVTAVDHAGNESKAKIEIKIKSEAYIANAVTYQPQDTSKSGEPKTGDSGNIETYVMIIMLSFFAYLFLFFFAGERERIEEKIKRLVSRMVQWKKEGGKTKILLANIAIFFLLLYYHSVGKLATTNWKKVYGVHNG